LIVIDKRDRPQGGRDVMEDLVKAIRHRRAILFAGAGVSMTVGLPSWRTLIDHIAEELRLDAEMVEGPDVNYLTLAEYYRLRQGSIGPLRSWMDRNWSIPEEALRESRVHELIARLDFPIIYTTNFDRNLETALQLHGKEFVKIVNAKDVARIREGVMQVVKFHGDFDDDQSIVIAETDYLDRLSFESPLDIKFRSDALGNTILFIGYSLSDLNIRFLLHRLWKTWMASGFERDRPQSYVFMMRPNPIEASILEQWGIRVIVDETGSPEHALETFLGQLADSVGVVTDDERPQRKTGGKGR
jgi:hypothetical protein